MSISQIRDRMIIDTIDAELSPMCWTDQQKQAWNRELDRDAQDENDAHSRYIYNATHSERTL